MGPCLEGYSLYASLYSFSANKPQALGNVMPNPVISGLFGSRASGTALLPSGRGPDCGPQVEDW